MFYVITQYLILAYNEYGVKFKFRFPIERKYIVDFLKYFGKFENLLILFNILINQLD